MSTEEIVTIYSGEHAPDLFMHMNPDHRYSGWLCARHPDGHMVALADLRWIAFTFLPLEPVYGCPAGCGCLWQDNKDGTMSLYGPASKSCAVCETLPLSKLLPVFATEIASAQQEAEPVDIHPAVMVFARAMQHKLDKNKHKDGKGWERNPDGSRNGWAGCSVEFLRNKLAEEYYELLNAVVKGDDLDAIRHEAADVGNIAMMLADVCGALPHPPKPAPLPQPLSGESLTLELLNDLKDVCGNTDHAIAEHLLCRGYRKNSQPVASAPQGMGRKCSECGNGEPDLSLYCVRCLNNDGWYLVDPTETQGLEEFIAANAVSEIPVQGLTALALDAGKESAIAIIEPSVPVTALRTWMARHARVPVEKMQAAKRMSNFMYNWAQQDFAPQDIRAMMSMAVNEFDNAGKEPHNE